MPSNLQVAGGKLFVADDYNRVLVFDPAPAATMAAASLCLGPEYLTSYTTGATASLLDSPNSVVVAGSRVVVVDTQNHRVLVWNGVPSASGAPADLVLGHATFTAKTQNDGGGATPSARSMLFPSDAWTDGTRLYVVDTNNNRVLGWNTFPTENGQAADLVLGQPDFTTSAEGATRGTLRNPFAVTSNGNQLFVADYRNHRVLVWNTLPTTTGALPDLVLGQSDFVHVTAIDDDQDGAFDGAASARTLYDPSGLSATDAGLFVTDSGNNRVLLFR
jgi:sugar lactone lactonase YvrE